ncbi:MAG: ABC transporter ATP-binding protein [Micrococcus sp.]|nr:ABC transporter ATP-binding protein [Micrococcus sp.]
MLKVSDLSVTYGNTLPALRGVSLEVPAGGSVALLGSNGAGKTTLLRAVSNTLRRHRGKAVSGSITFDGEELLRLDTAAIVGRNVVQVPEGRRIFGRLTVEENLRVGGMRSGGREAARARDHVYELFPRLKERRTQRGQLLSGGEQQMLAIGRALMAGPRLLMLDEPSLGLAPKIVSQVAEVVRAINAAGTAILIIEQNANMALGVADYAYVLERGQVSLDGDSARLKQTDEIKHLYLGHSSDEGGAPAPSLVGKSLGPWKEGR